MLMVGLGCGKIFIMEVFVQFVFGKVKFCVLIGKVVKVFYVWVVWYGFDVIMIYQLFEFSVMGFECNEECFVEVDIVVVDEGSMVDLVFFYYLLMVLLFIVYFVFVGDKDQFFFVGVGNVLVDVFKMFVDYYMLNVMYCN